MATRFYFHNATTSESGLPTAKQSTFFVYQGSAENPATVNRTMDTTIGVAQQTKQWASTATLNPNKTYWTRFVSGILAGSSISANTWIYNIATKQSNTNANFPVSGLNQTIGASCYVWNVNTQTVYGYIFDGNSAADVDEPAANTEVCHDTVFTGSAISSIPSGSRIILEMWFNVDQVDAVSYTDNVYYDGTTVNTTENSTVSNHASFLETPETLTFAAVNNRSISETAVTIGAGSVTSTTARVRSMSEVIA